NAMQGGYAVGNGLANSGSYGGGIISGTAQLGFSSSKYKSEYSQSSVVGSSATAGNSLSIVARGDNVNDAHNGDLTATAANLSGKDVSLSGKNVTLQSDFDTTHSSSKGSSFGGAIGIEVNTKGDIGVAANANGSKQHANGDSATGVNTTVSATDKVTITAPGKTTINGGIVSGNQVTVDTGNL
ncbi:hemagglutinin repeat-containing protein, partial [Commensalibacter nepenthis]